MKKPGERGGKVSEAEPESRQTQVDKRLISGVIWGGGGVAVTAALAGLFTMFHRGWYHALKKPPFTPPDFVFGIVWGAVYLCVAVAVCLLVYRGEARRVASLLIVSAALNALWPLCFFVCRLPALAFFVLLAAVAVGGILLYRLFCVKCLPFYLFLPYELWILFALALNYSITMLN